MGFDGALKAGVLGGYMEYLNRMGNADYPPELIALAKANPQRDPSIAVKG
jgi:hypothetical protein